MRPICKGDLHICPLISESNIPHACSEISQNVSVSVFFNKKPCAVVGSYAICKDGSKAAITRSSSKIYIEGKQLATKSSLSSHGGIFTLS